MMRYLLLLSLMLSLVTVSANTAFAQEQEVKDDLFTCFPRLDGLVPEGSPQKAEDMESLFSAINGGAEIYVRHGFLRALFHTYKDRNNKFFNLEIIEMKDVDAARKIYKLKKGNSKNNIEIGDEAVLEDYYLIYRQDRFYLSVTGSDSAKESRDTVIRIAGTVSEKIKQSYERHKR